MSLSDHKELWTTDKNDFALIKNNNEDSLVTHLIYDKVNKGYILIENDKESMQVIDKMLTAGVEVYDNLDQIEQQ